MSSIHTTAFCTDTVLDFAPLGGSRQDCAVVACTSLSMYIDGLAQDVILPTDILDTALAALCAPLIITQVCDLQERETLFRSPAVSVRLQSIDRESELRLCQISADTQRLSVTFQLDESETKLPNTFMREWNSLVRVDLRRTSVQCIGHRTFDYCRNLISVEFPVNLTTVGHSFLCGCEKIEHIDLRQTSVQTVGPSFLDSCISLTAVEMPTSLIEVSYDFLANCSKLERIDLQNTALQKIGSGFALCCRKLTMVVLPESVSELDRRRFLYRCGHVNVVSEATVVKAAAAEQETLRPPKN